MCNVLRGSTVDKCKTLTETENSMTLKQAYDQFMNVAEYGHLHIEAFKMTKEFYIKLLNSDLKKTSMLEVFVLVYITVILAK